jgi:TolA-binding protein
MRETPPPARIDQPKPVPRPVEPAPKPIPPVVDTTQPEPTEVSTAIVPPGGKRTPELALQEGHAALGRRDYTAAERSAREVMANRASPRAYDGQFLLAQALAGEKQFAQAAIAYDDAYNRSHKGRHAQDALLGLAGALTAINEKKAACDTLGRMRTEFPQVRVDLQDVITKTNERAGCGR